MAEQCFIKQGAIPPVCGLHSVRLVECQTSDETIAAGVGDFIFLECPVSGQVLDDSPPEASISN